MDNNMKQLINNIQQSGGGHILYCFNELEAYIENEATFISASVEQGERILVVENDRILPFVYKKLQFIRMRSNWRKRILLIILIFIIFMETSILQRWLIIS
ncbi:hypothetical protein ACQKKK_00260 [Peribacillus sp. NPDC006672]|uniref:hypothetical protein n=1 Tax=Peribacillus sp. NPDC006672 TaxID=3390606 RepID=UPI003D0223E8